METSTAQAQVLVDELIRGGVEDVVLAPGSRSAPLALALSAAERAGRLCLHVRIDERSAGYLAVGLAKVSQSPVAVVTTSGTAAVNLHPALVEADESGIPILALTADRPGPLRQVGANQAIEQLGIFGTCVRRTFELQIMSVADEAQQRAAVRYWRSTVAHAIAVATDPTDPGPVQLNLPFADPLVPGPDTPKDGATGGTNSVDVTEASEPAGVLAGRPDDRPWTIDGRMFGAMSVTIDDVLDDLGWSGPAPTRGLILVGDQCDADAIELIDDLSEAMGWPIIGEPSGNVAGCALALAHGPLLLASPSFAEAMRPDFVLTVGRLGLTRSVLRTVAQSPWHVTVNARAPWADPTRTADMVITGVPLPSAHEIPANDWLVQWQRADVLAAAAIETAVHPELFTGIDVARSCASAVPPDGLLFLGASWPVRHAAAFAGRSPSQAYVVGNRGTSGIDGSLSTAWGAAVAHQRADGGVAVALVGDLAFRYDDSALMIPAQEAQPNLVIVVSDNDGGGIFSQLEQGQPQFADHFERVFGTPVTGDVAELARACGLPVTVVQSEVDLRAALPGALTAGGVQVIVARTCARAEEARILTSIQAAVSEAIDASD